MATHPKQTYPSEHVEQRNFVKWFRQNHEERIFAIPNGEKRHKSVASRLKAEGVSAGVPDLFIPEWHLWIEMKRQKGGTVSKVQAEWRDYLRSCGYTWERANGCDHAKEIIENFKKSKFSS